MATWLAFGQSSWLPAGAEAGVRLLESAWDVRTPKVIYIYICIYVYIYIYISVFGV